MSEQESFAKKSELEKMSDRFKILYELKDVVMNLDKKYEIRHVETTLALKSIVDSFKKLEESALRDREQHSNCKAPMDILLLRKEFEQLKIDIKEYRIQIAEEFTSISSSLNKLKEETEVARFNQRFPEKARNMIIGMAVITITTLAGFVTAMYKLFIK